MGPVKVLHTPEGPGPGSCERRAGVCELGSPALACAQHQISHRRPADLARKERQQDEGKGEAQKRAEGTGKPAPCSVHRPEIINALEQALGTAHCHQTGKEEAYPAPGRRLVWCLTGLFGGLFF